MITNITSKNAAYGIQEYVCDLEQEIENLPKGKKQGSLAFVIETSSYYMLDGDDIWEPVEMGGGGGSGGISKEEFDNFKEAVTARLNEISALSDLVKTLEEGTPDSEITQMLNEIFG